MSKKSEKVVLTMVRGPNGGLVPATPFDAEAIERYKIGHVIHVTVEQPKNPDMVRLYFGLCGHIAKASGKPLKVVDWYLRGEAGAIREYAVFDGSTSVVPDSIAEMDQAQFSEFFDRVVEHITTVVFPGSTTKEIMDGLYDYAKVVGP